MMLPTFGSLLLMLLLFFFFFFLIFTTTPAAPSSSLSVTVGVTDTDTDTDTDTVPVPSAWPFQFHSLLFVNTSSFTLQAIDLWYDWPNSRNFNIIHKQLNNTLYDLEWGNGTSFYYDLDAQTCFTLHFDVGILRPDWMVDNSTYLGQQVVDGFTCNVWTKADFIVYYEDVETNRPVHWVFYTGTSVHVMTFEVGAVLEDSEWQAPAYCFDGQENSTTTPAANPLTMNAGNEEKQLERWHNSLHDTFFTVKNELNLYTK